MHTLTQKKHHPDCTCLECRQKRKRFGHIKGVIAADHKTQLHNPDERHCDCPKCRPKREEQFMRVKPTEAEFEEQFLNTIWNWFTGAEKQVDRTGRDYIKWTQSALNKILGLRLVVDGVSGVKTKSAVRDFQRRSGLTADGIVGPVTEKAFIANGAGQPPTTSSPHRIPSALLTGFHPTAVENPGGGRITDKRDPSISSLVTVTGVGGKKVQLHTLAAKAWEMMVQAARPDGIQHPLLLPSSGYRSRSHQESLWKKALAKYGSPQAARKWVAPPGGSPHHSGRAIDFYLGASNSSSNVATLRRTAAYQWLVNNAQRFGFYPYSQEPWHWEYNPPMQTREYQKEQEMGC